jgi:hypothetical protein
LDQTVSSVSPVLGPVERFQEPPMGNFLKDNEYLRFYVERYVDWAPIVEVTELGRAGAHEGERLREALEAYGDMLDMRGTFAADTIAPAGLAIDRAGGHTLQGGEVRSPRRATDGPRHDVVTTSLTPRGHSRSPSPVLEASEVPDDRGG